MLMGEIKVSALPLVDNARSPSLFVFLVHVSDQTNVLLGIALVVPLTTVPPLKNILNKKGDYN